MSTRLGASALETECRFAEMRAHPRYPILQPCDVRPTEVTAPQRWQCIAYNVSMGGVAITLPVKLPAGTVLAIYARNLPRACPLQARIVYAKSGDELWFTGCQLVRPLSDDELRVWCSGPQDCTDEPER